MKLFSRATSRLQSVHVNHKEIAAGALITAGFVAISKLGVVIREIGFAWKYGASAIVDQYQLALTITTWVPILITGVCSSVLVPLIVRVMRRGRDAQFVPELNGVAILIALVTGVITLAWITPASYLLTSGANAEAVAYMAYRMVPASVMATLAGYLSIRLQAAGSFSYNLTELAPVLIVTMFAVAATPRHATEAIAWGVSIGWAAQVLWLAGVCRNRRLRFVAIRLGRRSPEWPGLSRNLLLLGVGQILVNITVPFDQALAARLGEGSVAAYGYATRVLGLLLTFGTMVIGRSFLPVLSRITAEGEATLGKVQTLKWSLALLGLGFMVAALAWPFTPLAVNLMFERGAFSAESAQSVIEIIQAGLLQIPFYFSALVLVQWLAALGRYGALTITAIVAICVKLLATILLYKSMGLKGLVLATTLMHASSFTIQYLLTRRKNA